MIDTRYMDALASGADVWCDFAEREARTAEGFCQLCGSTEHAPRGGVA